ncbi:contact-dependent growth inhibition system immunity protein [Arenibacter sp. S6351L]|nr:contact-dependent growth inhibition system immunity protein [Arenibacter sp. S6351L]MCK0137423.1 contact-dependent growth inhibition system immunity protein [Arenibacter sp. S6351L]
MEPKFYKKSIKQLEKDYSTDPSEFPTGLVENCYKYRKIPIEDLNIEQLRLLISQKIGIEYLIGIVLKTLERNAIAEGNLYEGDLLIAVSKIPSEFWKENKKEFGIFKRIVTRNSELIKNELGEKEFNELLNRLENGF